jgi:hypothetical protein
VLLREIVLDTNVIGRIACSPAQEREAAIARLAVVKRKGGHRVITPTVLSEIAATYAKEATFDKLLAILPVICDGCLDRDAPEILRFEVETDDPYAILTARDLLPVTAQAIRDTVAEQEVQKFYAEGGFGNAGLRHLLDGLDPLRKMARNQLESFPEYVEARRVDWLNGFLSDSQERGVIPKREWDVEALWQKGAAWRFSTLVYLANEYRRLTQTQEKGEGCLTDLRIVIEAAYSHRLLTADKEFAGCGALANKVSRMPKILAW